MGVVRRKTLPGTTWGMGHVCFFRHALALDERRVKFLPEFAYAGRTVIGEPTSVAGTEASYSDMSSPHRPHIKEVWFVGTHSGM